jgi:hypothetical protein
VKFHSLRNSLIGCALALLGAFALGSCGGGGATGNNQGGNLQMFPFNGTFYAGVPSTITIVGGRQPYRITSGDPTLLPVPFEVNSNQFTVIPNQPGVIDTGIGEGELPVRTVLVQATDAENLFQQIQIQVAQNLLTGYGFSLTSNCAASEGAEAGPGACAGGESVIRIEANFNGTLAGLRTYRLEFTRGPAFWVWPDGQVAGNTITVVTDHEGKAFAIFRVPAGVPTQIAAFRIVDVETGVSTEHVFTITGQAVADELEILPDSFTFGGAHSGACGTGSGSFLVFDGIPPYTAFSAFSEVVVTPTTSDSNPGVFSFSVSNPNICLTDASIIITDSRNARGTVTINTEAGEGDPPPPPLRAIPTSVTVTCSAPSASFLVAGGDATATISASENDARLSLSPPAGRQITVNLTPTNPGGATLGPTVTSNVTVTDGASVITVVVRRPTDCT